MWSSSWVSALSLFPFPPPDNFTPPLSLSVAVLSLSLLLVVVLPSTRSFARPEPLGVPGENFLAQMGDIEAPDSNGPRQSVLRSVLPSREFASSRKGMLLLAEVVRAESKAQLLRTNAKKKKLLVFVKRVDFIHVDASF